MEKLSNETVGFLAVIASITLFLVCVLSVGYHNHPKNIEKDNYLVDHCKVLAVTDSPNGLTKYNCEAKK